MDECYQFAVRPYKIFNFRPNNRYSRVEISEYHKNYVSAWAVMHYTQDLQFEKLMDVSTSGGGLSYEIQVALRPRSFWRHWNIFANNSKSYEPSPTSSDVTICRMRENYLKNESYSATKLIISVISFALNASNCRQARITPYVKLNSPQLWWSYGLA